jgi:hypothetical protein
MHRSRSRPLRRFPTALAGSPPVRRATVERRARSESTSERSSDRAHADVAIAEVALARACASVAVMRE